MRIQDSGRAPKSDGRRALLLAASALAVMAGSAHAQNEPPPPPTAAQAAPTKPSSTTGGYAVEQVTVTARRREERLIDVPVAANVVSRETLDRYATTDLTDIQRVAPGILIDRTGGGTPGTTVRIRGIGVFGPDYGSEQPVSIVIDGVPIARGHVLDAGFFDQASIQVLKGPQALFFGKNSPAGVVSIDSVSPGRKLEGYVRASYGFATEDPTIEGAITLPLGDKFSIRFAGRAEDMQGGYNDNEAKPLAVNPIPDPIFGGKATSLPGANYDVYPQTKQLIGRITAVWKPIEQFDATFKVLGSSFHNNSSYGSDILINCANGNHPSYVNALTGIAYVDTGFTCGQRRATNEATPPADILNNYYGAPKDGEYFSDATNFLSILTLNYRLPWVTLTSVSGFYRLASKEFSNYDITIFAETPGIQAEKTKTFTQEFRATTELDFPVNFSAGAFFEHEHRTLYTTNRIFPLTVLPPNTPNQERFAGISNSMINFDDNTSENYSVFGQARWKITDTIELAGGGRFTKARKKADLTIEMQRLDTLFAGLPGGAPKNSSLSPAGTIYNIRTRYDDFSPEVTLSWKPTPDILVYGAYKTGFLAGGIANPGVVSNYTDAKGFTQAQRESILTFQPETTEGEEVGIKGTFLDRRLTADLTVFYYDFSGLQIATFHPENATFTVGNAASAVNKGAELNFNYRLTPEFSVRGALEYVSLKYGDYANAPCYPGQVAATGCIAPDPTKPKIVSQNLNGARFGASPVTINVGGTYNTTVGGAFDLQLTGDVQFYSRSPPLNAQPQAVNPAHTVLNASARLAQSNGPWSIALIGTNLNDEVFYNVIGGKPLGNPLDITGIVNPGREIRLQADYRF